MLGDHLGAAGKMSAVTSPFGITFANDSIDDVAVSGRSIQPHALTKDVGRIQLGKLFAGGGMSLKVSAPAWGLAAHKRHCILAYCEYNHGRVVVLSNLATFSGRYIDQADNAILLENILDYLLAPASGGSGRSTGIATVRPCVGSGLGGEPAASTVACDVQSA